MTRGALATGAGGVSLIELVRPVADSTTMNRCIDPSDYCRRFVVFRVTVFVVDKSESCFII